MSSATAITPPRVDRLVEVNLTSSPEHLAIVRRGSSEQLVAWAERVLHAHDPDEVLGSA